MAKTWPDCSPPCPRASLGVDLNPGNLLLNGHSPLDAATVLRPWILHVHVSDAVCGPAARIGQAGGRGQGDADFPALFSTLQVHGYRGYFTIQQQDITIHRAILPPPWSTSGDFSRYASCGRP